MQKMSPKEWNYAGKCGDIEKEDLNFERSQKKRDWSSTKNRKES